jgi:hypothetical protein
MVISCPECGGKVSTGATRCPHCGAPSSLWSGDPASPSTSAAPPRQEHRTRRALVHGHRPSQPQSGGGIAIVVVLALLSAGAAFFFWQRRESDTREEAIRVMIEGMRFEEQRRQFQIKERARKTEEVEADQYLSPLEKDCAKSRISENTNACQHCKGKAVEFTKRGIAVKCECCRGEGKH